MIVINDDHTNISLLEGSHSWNMVESTIYEIEQFCLFANLGYWKLAKG